MRTLTLVPRPYIFREISMETTVVGCLHGDAFIHYDIIPECPWPSRVAWWKYSSGDTDGRIAS